MKINTFKYEDVEKMLPDKTSKVSIIVPTYKRSDSLKATLESLVIQTYSNIEIIVIDDNGDLFWNKKVEKIVNQIQKIHLDIPIIYIQNEINKGSAATRNIGIRQSVGEYITFLDDDDIYLPNKVKYQVEHMMSEKSDFSLTDLYLYDDKWNLVEKRIRNYVINYSKESLLKYHLLHHMTGTDVIMFKKDYLEKIGLFSTIDIGDEFYLMLKAIENGGRFSYLQGCEVKAIVHSETEGLSSGDRKLKGEKALYNYKKKYFEVLTKREKRTIKMRHYAVLAFTEFRRKRYFSMLKNLCSSFFSSPIQLVSLYINRK